MQAKKIRKLPKREAYEKTLDELNKKLELKKLDEKEFENTIKIQVETIESLKSQVKKFDNTLLFDFANFN
jgi:hypothetical protein